MPYIPPTTPAPASPRHSAVACWMCPACRTLFANKEQADACAGNHQIAMEITGGAWMQRDRYPRTLTIAMSDGSVLTYTKGGA